MKKFFSLVLAGILLSASGFAQPGKNKAAAPANAPAQFGNAAAITADQLKAYLSFIASDEMEGRDTPSKGLDITAKFIATMLSRWGIQPAGDNGTYFQKMSLHRNKLEPEGTITTINGQTFKFGDDFLARPRGGSVSGQCVYVGHGWVIKDKNINSYQTETGTINVRDKIVVATPGYPKGVSFRRRGSEQNENWIDPVKYAAQNGAKAVIFVPSFGSILTWQRTRQKALVRGALRPDKITLEEEENETEINMN